MCSGEKRFSLSVILVEKLYVFVQLLQKYVRVKIKNSCLHNITGVDMDNNTVKMENNPKSESYSPASGSSRRTDF